jgi:hypothetical protein
MLNLSVHGPTRPEPAPPLLRAALYAENRSAGTLTTYSSSCGRPTPSCAAAARAWRPLPRATSRRSWPTCWLGGWPAPPPPPQGPQDPLRLVGGGRGDPSQPDGQVRALLAELMPLSRADSMRAASTSGVLGDPMTATAVEGATLLAELGAALIRQVRAWQPVVAA